MKRDDPEAIRAYRRKYNASPKGRAARERYAATEKGRTAQLKSKRQYNHAHTTELKAYNVQRRREFGERIDAIKIEKGCSRCGYRGHPAALDFDHVDPMSKRANVSNLARFGSWATIEAEIAKCDVLRDAITSGAALTIAAGICAFWSIVGYLLRLDRHIGRQRRRHEDDAMRDSARRWRP